MRASQQILLAARRAERAAVTRRIRELKSAPCTDCGGTFDPVCMDFDHRPGEEKIDCVSSLAWMGLDAVLAEISKCDLVCANCHRLRTKVRADAKIPSSTPVVDLAGLTLDGALLSEADARRALRSRELARRRDLAISIARSEGRCSTARLARELGLSPGCVSPILRELERAGALVFDALHGFSIPQEIR